MISQTNLDQRVNKSYCLDKNYAKVVQEDVYDGLECTKGIGKLSVNGKKLSFFYPEDGKSIEKTYDRINYLKSGFYVVSKDGKQAVLNTEYQEVLPFSEQRYYSIIPPNFLIVPSSENTMAVGLEDFKGNELLPRIFERITIENEDYFSVSSRKQIAYFKRKK